MPNSRRVNDMPASERAASVALLIHGFRPAQRSTIIDGSRYGQPPELPGTFAEERLGLRDLRLQKTAVGTELLRVLPQHLGDRQRIGAGQSERIDDLLWRGRASRPACARPPHAIFCASSGVREAHRADQGAAQEADPGKDRGSSGWPMRKSGAQPLPGPGLAQTALPTRWHRPGPALHWPACPRTAAATNRTDSGDTPCWRSTSTRNCCPVVLDVSELLWMPSTRRLAVLGGCTLSFRSLRTIAAAPCPRSPPAPPGDAIRGVLLHRRRHSEHRTARCRTPSHG